MMNNDVLRSLRFMLNIKEADLAALMLLPEPRLCSEVASAAQLESYLLPEEQDGHVMCPDRVLEDILNGLIVQKRGVRPAPVASTTGKNAAKPTRKSASTPTSQQASKPSARIDNNMILKKLRIAFNLQEDDMLELLSSAEFAVSRPELSALFRAAGHKHYRACGDQLLRYFLKGLTHRIRPSARGESAQQPNNSAN